MFEVGKKYKKDNFGGHYECLNTYLFRKGSVAGVLKFVGEYHDPEDMGDIPTVYQWSDKWTEYHEPVVRECVRYVAMAGEDIFTSLSLPLERYRVGKMKLTVTDGKLTGVEIL